MNVEKYLQEYPPNPSFCWKTLIQIYSSSLFASEKDITLFRLIGMGLVETMIIKENII